MAHDRLDVGSTRWLLNDLCRPERLGYKVVAALLGKKVPTIKAYVNPKNPRKIPLEDQRILARHMFLTFGERVPFPDLDPDTGPKKYPTGGTPPSHTRGMDDLDAPYPWPRRAMR